MDKIYQGGGGGGRREKTSQRETSICEAFMLEKLLKFW